MTESDIKDNIKIHKECVDLLEKISDLKIHINNANYKIENPFVARGKSKDQLKEDISTFKKGIEKAERRYRYLTTKKQKYER